MKNTSTFNIQDSTLFNGIYNNKTVLLTGHTGFKGSWLCFWLIQMGAKVIGYSLEPPTSPNHFELLHLDMVSIMSRLQKVETRKLQLAGTGEQLMISNGCNRYNARSPVPARKHLLFAGDSIIGDIRDSDGLDAVFAQYQPEIVFHLAAQPLVRLSYKEPVETFETNVVGTLKVFEACRKTKSVRAIVNITSDKCYENREWVWGYRENDPMEGVWQEP